MVSRPAFLARFLARLPDPRSLRLRIQGGVGLVAGLFGALLVVGAVQLDARRCAEVARERAETLAGTVGPWLDGDAHAGLGAEPEKRLSDATASLEKALETSAYPGTVRTLRPATALKGALAAQPGARRAGALEVVLQTGEGVVKGEMDYRPEMAEALFEGRTTSHLAEGRVSAYAPVPDSWGSIPAIVWVSGPATAPLFRQVLFFLGSTLLAGLLVSFVLMLARRASERLELVLAALDSGVRELAAGQLPGPFALSGAAPRELASLAESLDALRSRLEAQATGQPLPQPLPSATGAETPGQAAQSALLGEASEFDLALLVQQVVEPARKQAGLRGVEVQLVFPDGLPSQLVGHPMVLYRALDALLRNALRTTTRGRITVRVSRAASSEGDKLRFEVADTSPGVAFKEQQELSARLAEAALGDPSSMRDSVQIASALAHALGGELSFVSQPGQGSRFGFTASFQGLGPAPATGFHPQVATGFHPQPATAFQPRAPLPSPVSAAVPRPRIGTRRING
jgi:signal transduction histidine kinase